MELTVNDRISVLIDNMDSNPNAFAEKIGVKATVVYNIIKGRRSKPSFEVLQKIFTAFHALNLHWLMRGEGNIWTEEQLNNETVIEKKITLGVRVAELLASIEEKIDEEHLVKELEELVTSLTSENHEHKLKIVQLYEKQDQILEVFRRRLNLDI